MKSKTPEFQIGKAFREITPAYPVWLYGYSARNRKSEDVSEPLYIGCLSISDRTRTVLIFTCDLLGIESHICETLYEMIEEQTGIGFPDVLIACSHTHFAPGLHQGVLSSPELGIVEPDETFVEDFKIKMLEAARESLRRPLPVQLKTTRVLAPQAVFNRRTLKADGNVQTNFLFPEDADNYTFSKTDHQITVLRFVDDAGTQAMLINFGCHPVTGGNNHYAISSDYQYYLRNYLTERYKCPVFFTLGAAGDTVPINRYGDSRKLLGNLLANSIILAERTYTSEKFAEVKSDFLTLPVRTIFDTESHTARTDFERAKTRLITLQNSAEFEQNSDAYTAEATDFSHKLIALKRSRLYPDNSYSIKIQFIQIGKTILVGYPFEVLSEISLKMKEHYPNSVLVSCSGGYQGYLPLKYEYDRGGYEATIWSTHFERGVGDRLLHAVLGNPFLKRQSSDFSTDLLTESPERKTGGIQ